MTGQNPWRGAQARKVGLWLAVAITLGILLGGRSRTGSQEPLPVGERKGAGYPRLVSVESLPEMESNGPMCKWVPASSPMRLHAALRQERPAARGGAASVASPRSSVSLERPPLRVIRDSYPTFSAVALDTVRNEIVLQDENLFQILVYDRLANTPPTATLTEPKRVIGGHETKIEFNCGLYVDPKTGDIYSVNNDTLDTLTIFSRNAVGNVHPDGQLHTPHRTYGIAVDEQAGEMFLTVQHPPMLAVYHKTAREDDPPIRILRGNNTQLEDAHGIALDTRNGWIFVANYGNVSDYKDQGGNSLVEDERKEMILGSGKNHPPSITVYPIQATGNVAPLRIIEGPRTRLNWPAHLSMDEEHGELYVANDGEDSILVFDAAAQGNIPPKRILQGPNTGIKNPTGVIVDTVHNELIVSNMGNHSATVYPRTAQGNSAPIRTIRAGPPGKVALQIGNPGAVGYDTKRDEILVPN